MLGCTMLFSGIALLLLTEISVNAAGGLEEFLDLKCHRTCLTKYASLTFEECYCNNQTLTALRTCNKKCMLGVDAVAKEAAMFTRAQTAVCVESPAGSPGRTQKLSVVIDEITKTLGDGGKVVHKPAAGKHSVTTPRPIPAEAKEEEEDGSEEDSEESEEGEEEEEGAAKLPAKEKVAERTVLEKTVVVTKNNGKTETKTSSKVQKS